ncbi:hypothetical protein D918_08374 [Trichuris suis]|nr:hypothetical protein D918_08374 [Trichuris suis]
MIVPMVEAVADEDSPMESWQQALKNHFGLSPGHYTARLSQLVDLLFCRIAGRRCKLMSFSYLITEFVNAS